MQASVWGITAISPNKAKAFGETRAANVITATSPNQAKAFGETSAADVMTLARDPQTFFCEMRLSMIWTAVSKDIADDG